MSKYLKAGLGRWNDGWVNPLMQTKWAEVQKRRLFRCRRCLSPSYLCFPDSPNPTYVPAARAIWRFVTTIVFIKTRIPSTIDDEYNYHGSLHSPARKLACLGRVSRPKAAELQLRAGDAGEKNEAPHSSHQFLVAVSLLLLAICYPNKWAACSQAKIACVAGRRRRGGKSKWALCALVFPLFLAFRRLPRRLRLRGNWPFERMSWIMNPIRRSSQRLMQKVFTHFCLLWKWQVKFGFYPVRESLFSR